MNIDDVLGTIWRRRWEFIATAAIALGLVIGVTLTLDRQYESTATLFVGERQGDDDALALDTNIGEQLARTYTTLAAQPALADEVRRTLRAPMSRQELLDRMTFAPVERTQLLQITARATTPEAAAELAGRYARTFVARVGGSFARGGAPTRVSLAEAPVAPEDPSSPNVPLYLAFGFVLALLLAIAAVLLRERLDDGLRISAYDLTLLDQRILARVPRFDTHNEPSQAVEDSFRLLRANVEFAREKGPRTIAITSSMPREGKSTIAAQLTLAAGHAGDRVVLVEADLRRPSLAHSGIGREVARSDVGLSSYLARRASIEEILRQHPSLPGTYLISAGPLPSNPSALLASDAFGTLIASLALRFDRVVVDTSPISVGPDASVVISRVDGVLYVVDAEGTRLSHARSGLAQVETTRADVLGIVVNRDPAASARPHDYYGAERPAPGAAADRHVAAAVPR